MDFVGHETLVGMVWRDIYKEASQNYFLSRIL